MCLPSAPKIAQPPPPPPPPPPEDAKPATLKTAQVTPKKKSGAAALRIDLAGPTSPGGSGLNIPSG